MNDKQIRSLITVVECGSFSKAAKSLFISPQALYQQIELLEAEMGFPLLIRHAKGVSTTPAGAYFYRGACKLMEENDTLLLNARKLNRHVTSVVRLCQCGNYADPHLNRLIRAPLRDNLGELILEPIAIYPSKRCFNSVVSGECHAAVYPELSNIADAELAFTPDPTDAYTWGCLLACQHPLGTRERITPLDLDQGDLFTYYPEATERLERYLHSHLSQVKLKTFAPLSTFDREFSSISDICLHGGLFLMPRAMATAFPYLAFVPLDFDMNVCFGLIHSAQPAGALKRFLALYDRP